MPEESRVPFLRRVILALGRRVRHVLLPDYDDDRKRLAEMSKLRTQVESMAADERARIADLRQQSVDQINELKGVRRELHDVQADALPKMREGLREITRSAQRQTATAAKLLKRADVLRQYDLHEEQ